MGNVAPNRTSTIRVSRVLLGLALVVGVVLVLDQGLLEVMIASRPELGAPELTDGFTALGFVLIGTGAAGLIAAIVSDRLRARRGRRGDTSASTPFPPSDIHPSANAAPSRGAAAAGEASTGPSGVTASSNAVTSSANDRFHAIFPPRDSDLDR